MRDYDSGYGSVDALVVNTVRRGPGQMTGMGDLTSDIVGALDTATGGAVTNAEQQLADLKLALKISIAASVFAGAAALWMVFKAR